MLTSSLIKLKNLTPNYTAERESGSIQLHTIVGDRISFENLGCVQSYRYWWYDEARMILKAEIWGPTKINILKMAHTDSFWVRGVYARVLQSILWASAYGILLYTSPLYERNRPLCMEYVFCLHLCVEKINK